MRLWPIVLLVTAALAGCAGEDPIADPVVEPDPEDNEIEEPEEPIVEANNTAPVANLTADILNGTAPLLVNLTLHGSDADGDNLTWSLQVNGTQTANGTQLPATVVLNLTAGNHSVLLTLSDGEAETSANLTVAVAASGPTVAPILEVLEMVEGCWLCIDAELVTGEPMGAPGCVGWNLEDNELDCGWVEIPAEYHGLPYSVFSFTSGTLVPFGSDGHPDVEFYDGCSPDATLIEQHFEQNGDTVIGVIPDGAGCIVGFEFHWPNVGHTIEFSLGAVAHG